MKILCIDFLVFRKSLLLSGILFLLWQLPVHGRIIYTPLQQDTVKIGLLVPDKQSFAATEGAHLAVLKANSQGGINGSPVKLEVRSMEGPWGTGSKQAVNLIFEEKVWALFGSHDGRNAHLVEQAATKATVVFVSAWSADPTLSQAFVPWFYNCVPNDFQQAETLVNEIYNNRKYKSVAAIYDSEYDSDLAFKNFIRKTELDNRKEPLRLLYENYSNDLKELIEEIENEDIDCIVLFCSPLSSLKILREIKKNNTNLNLYGSLNMMNEDLLSDKELAEFDDIMTIPSPAWDNTDYLTFKKEYHQLYAKTPGMMAVYAFDGMNLLISAIRAAGNNERENIQQALSEISYKGISRTISFDDKGNRLGPFYTVTVKNGLPVFPGN